MRTILYVYFVAIVVAFLPSGSIANEASSAANLEPFVRSIGQFWPAAGLEIDVSDAGDGKVSCKAIFRQKTTAGPRLVIRSDAPWFIYAASASDVWIYNGKDTVLRIEFSETGIKFTDNDVVSGLLNAAPPLFRERLPDRLRP